MKLTTKGRNAVTAMLDMCINANNQPVNLTSIYTRQGVSVHYLEQIFLKLRKAGLVRSIRGPGGGYVLDRCPSSIKIGEIIKAVEDSLQVTKCTGLANCHNGKTCISHYLWHELEQVLNTFLYHVSLYDVAYSKTINSSKLYQVEYYGDRP